MKDVAGTLPAESRSIAVANNAVQRTVEDRNNVPYRDNRPEAVLQRKIQEAIKHSLLVRHVSQLKASIHNIHRRNSRNSQLFDSTFPIQRKARVDDFNVKWANNLIDEKTKAAGFEVLFDAKFSKEDGYSPEHAEFHQYAADFMHVYYPDEDTEEDRNHILSQTRKYDNYDRANDPGDYKDAAGLFDSHDVPGIADGLLQKGDEIKEYWVTLDQEIVDTERNVRLAYTKPQTSTIKGIYPDKLKFVRAKDPSVIYTPENK